MVTDDVLERPVIPKWLNKRSPDSNSVCRTGREKLVDNSQDGHVGTGNGMNLLAGREQDILAWHIGCKKRHIYEYQIKYFSSSIWF